LNCGWRFHLNCTSTANCLALSVNTFRWKRGQLSPPALGSLQSSQPDQPLQDQGSHSFQGNCCCL
ncbi:hypothetical protein AMECASPLE_012226, partial [Ameca splendens]